MPPFRVVSDFKPAGDQPSAIDKLVYGIDQGVAHQTMLGVTGSGKTFTMANIIERTQRPTLVIAHNKTLAAQLATEFKDFLPDNAVEYFVSYYDYYQPEAYIPRTDTYIEKDSSINEEIDRLRHAATRSLLTRRDVVIVASVSCIYGLGDPAEYHSFVANISRGEQRSPELLARSLVEMQYERNNIDFTRGTFRVRGDTLDIFPAYEELPTRISFWGDEIERILDFDPLTGEILAEKEEFQVFPAKHFVTSKEKRDRAIETIKLELQQQTIRLRNDEKILEAARLEQRTNYDLEMLQEIGYCSGIENYSRHLSGRTEGSTPWTLLDYFPEDFLLFIDESHMSVPQIRGMYRGDISRKHTLVEFGFRLPSALDNRPLEFLEFEQRVNQVIFVSATPSTYEMEKSQLVTEQVIRPTGLLDPTIQVKPTRGQIDDLLAEINPRITKGERILVTTLTKRMAEELADYLREMGIKVHYLHSDIVTLERSEILRDLRLGVYDVVVGINLLREGLDLPEVSLVAILDADKEGYLRSQTSLIQTIGRAARHENGHVIMYADWTTRSMENAISETYRRRSIQEHFNKIHGIVPSGIQKEVRDITQRIKQSITVHTENDIPENISKDQMTRMLKLLEKQMKEMARNLEFEKAATLRDQVLELRRLLVEFHDPFDTDIHSRR
ncbi:excinuclease ABC subunit UvrB [SAR202 cluster bacterium AD-802-E10_MRT_200m]|nr:excinuclease ABC subunit UvrB [SAR202 cluster bacterium AD-802-E10_MRT_200m]